MLGTGKRVCGCGGWKRWGQGKRVLSASGSVSVSIKQTGNAGDREMLGTGKESGNAGDRERECVGVEMLGTGKERGKWRN